MASIGLISAANDIRASVSAAKKTKASQRGISARKKVRTDTGGGGKRALHSENKEEFTVSLTPSAFTTVSTAVPGMRVEQKRLWRSVP